jgi:cephalosporin-C deacetylase
MPCIDLPLDELKTYRGTSPKPADHDAYWQGALAELDATSPEPEWQPTQGLRALQADTLDFRFTGIGGSRIYAKYLRPKTPGPHPTVFLFHGYSLHSGDWHDKLAYINQGLAVFAMDCRGQGGRSEDLSARRGNTQYGHFLRGIDDLPENMLFRQIYTDTVQLVRAATILPEVDDSRLGCVGASQGGALSLVCAALEPRIKRCVSLYPFLSDFRRVWEMDLAKEAYEELRRYFRQFDPLHLREDAIFERLGYLDIQHLVSRIQAEVLMGITLMDSVCPPSTQFAIYNKIRSAKTSLIYPDYAHEQIPGFMDRAFEFLGGLTGLESI